MTIMAFRCSHFVHYFDEPFQINHCVNRFLEGLDLRNRVHFEPHRRLAVPLENYTTRQTGWDVFEMIPCRNVKQYRLFSLFVAIILMA
jgi:hypothetical protein